MGNSGLAEEIINSIKEELFSSKSAERRKAVKKIGKHKIFSLAEDLLLAYIKENKNVKTWETQMEMVISLGKLCYKPALPYIEDIVIRNEEFDTITFYAAISYVRICREHNNDARPVISLLKKGKNSVFGGALAVLTYDDMIPNKNEIKEIIDIVNRTDKSVVFPTRTQEVQSYLISAMSKWDIELTYKYLNSNRTYSDLEEYINATLSRKKSRYE